MFCLLQVAIDSVTTPVVSTPTVQHDDMSLLELIMKGGVVMIPIFLLLALAIYLFVERLLFIRYRAKVNGVFLPNVRNLLHKGDIQAAKMLADNQNNALGAVIGSGIGSIGKSSSEMDSNIEGVASYELARMEKNLGYLGIIAGIAPMLGFIGTISGIIKIFYNISLSDNISIGIISGGLYEKMITSGAGLVVGIFAYTCYHLLAMMIDRFTLKMEGSVLEFKKLLQEPGV